MYKLEKYKNTTQKQKCPTCEHRSFVRYVDEHEQPLHLTVGRCDREDSCGYHYTPKMYFADNPDNKKEWTPQPQPIKKESPKPIDYIDMEKYIYPEVGKGDGLKKCNFADFLYRTFPQSDINSVLWTFFVGEGKDRSVIFPYIDAQGKCRTGKIMKYDPNTGKRIKDVVGSINWIHSVLKKRGILPETFNMGLCLFGEVQLQLSKNDTKPVAVVEAEKTAVIASLLMPGFVWMAAGALGWLNVEKLAPLKHRNIVLYPDTSLKRSPEKETAFEKWSRIADEAQKQRYRISVSDLLETKCTPQQKEAGYDIADYLMLNLQTAQTI